MKRLVLAITMVTALGGPAVAQGDLTPQPPTASEYSREPYRPSGFWTSTRPAQGGAYRYRMLGVGILFAIGGGLLVRRVIKRANAGRATTAAPTAPAK